MSHAGDLEWINDYVGVPYVENGRSRAGWDCWGLVIAIYRERLGIALPDWTWQEPFDLSAKLKAFAGAVAEVDAGAQALALAAPEPWAIALIHHDRRPHHVGVAVGDGAALGVLHAARYGGTLYDPLGRFLASYRGAAWFRWRR
jgi:cell wall-associated NlpC family hydrolase